MRKETGGGPEEVSRLLAILNDARLAFSMADPEEMSERERDERTAHLRRLRSRLASALARCGSSNEVDGQSDGLYIQT